MKIGQELYRGLQRSAEFRWLEHSNFVPFQQPIWRVYLEIQGAIMTDNLARARGLDIAGAGFAGALWSTTHQSFALERWVAQNKFGPCYVVCKTPLDNVRITTFFAGEHEARIIDPRRV